MDKLLIVSADGHAGAQIDDYQPYLAAEHRSALDDLRAENELYRKLVTRPLQPTEEALAVFDRREAVQGGGTDGAWDVDVRLRELDAEGIACEILHYSIQFVTTPFFSHVNRACSAELQLAGARAHNRWLADFMAPAAGRLRGVAELGPCHDLDGAVRELHWAAEHGFVAATMPGGLFDPSLPPLPDPSFDAFYSACEETGLVLSIHAGWGGVQGAFLDAIAKIKGRAKGRSPFAPKDEGDEPDPLHTMMAPSEADTPAMQQESPNRLTLGGRAPLWQLMFGGVFDRHPRLTVAMTEVRADWVPATLSVLDQVARDHRHDERVAAMRYTPSEYFQRNVVVTPSSIHRAEVEMRHEIGIDRLLFGADYPHWEGTWPNTRDWIRTAFEGVPIDEVRQILGANAIAAYGLDAPALRAVADRIGPSPALVTEGPADAALVDHFHQRSGYRRPADPVDVDTLATVVQEDLASLGS